jgi:glycosyltransferase involved in cell wall biosynthesis
MTSEFAATIVIPLLDQVDAWLEQCVRSALGQSVRCEVVVVLSPKTGSSNLRLLEGLAAQFDNLRVMPRDIMGFPGALNAGFRAASAQRIGILLSDDWLHPRAVEQCVPHDVDIVSTGNVLFDSDGKTVLHEVSRIRRGKDYLNRGTLERKARYLSHFFLFRKSKLDEIGGADESLGDFPGIDDFDMIWVMLEHGATVAIVEEQLYNYRDHGGERLTLRSPEQALAVLNRILDKHGVVGPERAKIIEEHAPWYGKPIHVAHHEQEKFRPGPKRK